MARELKALQKELKAEQESRLVPEVFVVSELVGERIDASERERYGLFPSVKEFISATYYKRPGGSFYVEFVTRGSGGKKEKATHTTVSGLMRLPLLRSWMIDYPLLKSITISGSLCFI